MASLTALSISPRLVLRVVIAILIFLLVRQFAGLRDGLSVPTSWRAPGSSSSSKVVDGATPTASCDAVWRGLDDFMVIMKTGSTDSRQKLPVHFNTTLRCVPHYVIYSDLEEDVEGHHLVNALDGINATLVAEHPDFEYYRQLQAQGNAAFSEAELAGWASAANSQAGRDSPGWKLDKWKFLPIAEKALAARPQAKWYIIIEHDTYVFWGALIEWLSHLKYTEKHYIGQQMMIGDILFAYGGSGIILSNPALKAVVEYRASDLHHWDSFTADHWAGDCILGKAIQDSGTNLLWAWPNILSEAPMALDFEQKFDGPATKLWCYYAVTYHHLLGSEISELYEFDQKWPDNHLGLPRHSDVFKSYLLPRIAPKIEDWDNLSEADEAQVDSFEECRQNCVESEGCVQFSLKGTGCKTSKVVQLGRKPAAGTESMASGWLLDRVDEYVRRLDTTCNGEDWVLSQ